MRKKYKNNEEILILTLSISQEDIDNFNNNSYIVNNKNLEVIDCDDCDEYNNKYDIPYNDNMNNTRKYDFVDSKFIWQNDIIIRTEGLNSLISKKCLQDNYTKIYNVYEIQKPFSVKCWWCCNYFDNHPIPVPCYYNDATDKFKVYGYFCSFNCAKAYIFKKKYYNGFLDPDNSLLLLLYYKLTKDGNCWKKRNYIKTAPPKEILKEFGGILTIEEYRKNFFQLDKTYKILPYPCIWMNTVIEETSIYNKKPKNSKKTLDEILNFKTICKS